MWFGRRKEKSNGSNPAPVPTRDHCRLLSMIRLLAAHLFAVATIPVP